MADRVLQELFVCVQKCWCENFKIKNFQTFQNLPEPVNAGFVVDMRCRSLARAFSTPPLSEGRVAYVKIRGHWGGCIQFEPRFLLKYSAFRKRLRKETESRSEHRAAGLPFI
eukprot:sb/3477026/